MTGSNSSKNTSASGGSIAEHLAPLIAAQPGPPTGRVRTLAEARRALSIPTSAAPEVLQIWGVPNDQLVAFPVSDDADPDLVAEFAALLVVHRDNGTLRTKPTDTRLRLAQKGNSLWIAYGPIVKAVDEALVIGGLNLGPAFDLQAGDPGNDAALGVTSELLRLVSPNRLLSRSVDYLDRYVRVSTITAHQAAAEQPDSAPATDEQRIGRGRRAVVSDELLAAMAMSYISLCRNGRRQPLPLLAAQFGIDRRQARDRIHQARQQGWLTSGGARRAGGEPGPRLVASGWQPPEIRPTRAQRHSRPEREQRPVRSDDNQQTDQQQTAEPQGAPRLTASIGSGYTGYYHVEATADKLVWQGPTGEADRSDHNIEVRLDAADWNTFWDELDRIHAWDWNERDYVTVGVLDGTHWQVEASDGQRQLRASGDNGYPETQTPDPSPAFNAFCRAVSRLAAGNTFS